MPDDNDPKRLILLKGESLIELARKEPGRGPREYPRTYSEAREKLLSEITQLERVVGDIPANKVYESEVTLALRLHPDFLPKTAEPDAFLSSIPTIRNVGSRPWMAELRDVAVSKRTQRLMSEGQHARVARLIFLAADKQRALPQLQRILQTAESSLPNTLKNDIRKIENLNLLTEEEQIPLTSFPEGWESGRVELVLHQSSLSFGEQATHLLSILKEFLPNFDERKVRMRPYENSPTYVSAPLTREALAALRSYNPLRVARSMTMASMPTLRHSPIHQSPKVPTVVAKSTIKVAVFDGGFDPSNPLLAGHCDLDTTVETPQPADPDDIAHGTAVAGAVLYGPLNKYNNADILPAPLVSVVGYRILPASDPLDIDLYEAIDLVERAANGSMLAKVINISFGPKGPIDDDNISRFTHVLDTLTHKHGLLPVVAVGNDGAVIDFDRIQSPSDAVNAIGVGAYSEISGALTRAPYSSKGPGREGCKNKPDVAAFGGCARNPIHLVSSAPNRRVLSAGTSFAAPIVARIAAEIMGRCPNFSPLLTRGLLIHASRHPDSAFDCDIGHGFCPTTVDEALVCEPKSVSIVFMTRLRRKVMPNYLFRFRKYQE